MVEDSAPRNDLEPEEDEPFVQPAAPPATADEQMEALYDAGTFRVISQLNNFLIPSIIQAIRDEQYLNVHPMYQRRLRWDALRQSRLIESLLMNVPIPPIFLYETDLARYEVVDGQQRLAAIDDFFNDRLELRGLQYWTVLNRRKFSNLPPRLQQALLRRSISAVVLLAESSIEADAQTVDVRRIVFERLNTGGVRLNAQEVRNAIYAGPFNSLLHDLARHPQFVHAWGIPEHTQREEQSPSAALARNLLYRTMGDCELVLRFFALADPDVITGSTKRTLDAAMRTRLQSSPQEIAGMKGDYITCLSAAVEIYGDSVFRLPPTGTRSASRPSKALYDAVMLGLRRHLTGIDAATSTARRATLIARRDLIRTVTHGLLSDQRSDSYVLLVGRLNTRDSIVDRIDLLEQVFAAVLADQ